MEFATTRGGAEAQLLADGNSSGYALPGVIRKAIFNVINQQEKLAG